MAWDEKDVYEVKRAQTRAYYIVSLVAVIGATLCVLAFLWLNRPPETYHPPPPPPPPKVTPDNCKTLCGDDGVEKYQVDEGCFCKKLPPKDKKLNCVCEPYSQGI